MKSIITPDERIIANTIYQLTSELTKSNNFIVWGTERGRATVVNENDLFITVRLKEVDYHFPEHVVSLINSLKEILHLPCRYASVYQDQDGYELSVYV